ncbi:MAG: low molecular weight protein arginine phosphatase, partial [Candidatus Bathyarchaeia archaeon]
MPKRILFVCTMNRNRSVMAEVIFKRLLQQVKNPSKSGIRCGSAGIRAPDGAPADASTFQVMKRRGFDLNEFESSRLMSELVREADLVLTMERAQKSQIAHTMPESASKVFT